MFVLCVLVSPRWTLLTVFMPLEGLTALAFVMRLFLARLAGANPLMTVRSNTSFVSGLFMLARANLTGNLVWQPIFILTFMQLIRGLLGPVIDMSLILIGAFLCLITKTSAELTGPE